MEEKGRGGKTALHILAFIGITLALLIVAALAALYITTRGPSEAARDNFVEWADSHGLGFAARPVHIRRVGGRNPEPAQRGRRTAGAFKRAADNRLRGGPRGLGLAQRVARD